MYYVTKTYGHELGLSACFRQWRAKSHCRFLHGYPLSFKFKFAAGVLDENNWVLDFGGLKAIKQWLCDTFDHKLLVAEDDPFREQLEALMPYGKGIIHGGERDGQECRMYMPEHQARQLADVLVIPYVGCEGFAKYVFVHAAKWLFENHREGVERRHLRLVSVEVREHGGNSAIYEG